MNEWREEDWYDDDPQPLLARACLCGRLREPQRVLRGSLSLLLCRRCGKPTTERN